jgi:hypothetical protein
MPRVAANEAWLPAGLAHDLGQPVRHLPDILRACQRRRHHDEPGVGLALPQQPRDRLARYA